MKNEILRQLAEYLACPCTEFEPMTDDDPVLAALRDRTQGIPVAVPADDILLEQLTDAQEMSREQLLNAELPDGRQVLQDLKHAYLHEMDREEWQELRGQMTDGECMDRPISYWDYETEKTQPLVVAQIPTDQPWKVFAWLPMGGWNECPDPIRMMAVAKYWYEQYGAVPVAVTHDTVEFSVPAPVPTEQAMNLAEEMYFFCMDIVDQGVETLGALADGLRQSTHWYFWWD